MSHRLPKAANHYSWIERPCQNRYTHFLSGCRKARNDLRPATAFSRRARSRIVSDKIQNSKCYKVAHRDDLIPPHSLIMPSGFVSGSTSLFTSTNQIVSSAIFAKSLIFPGVRNRKLSLSLRSAKSLMKSKAMTLFHVV